MKTRIFLVVRWRLGYRTKRFDKGTFSSKLRVSGLGTKMKIEFSNLGALNQGEIELNKLTVVCGTNNIGKTYLTYAVYGFLNTWEHFVESKVSKSDYDTLTDTGQLKIDLRADYLDQAKSLFEKAAVKYKGILSSVLASNEERFANTSIQFKLDDYSTLYEDVVDQEFTSAKGRRLLSFKKSANSNVLEISFFAAENANFEPPPRRLIEDTITKIVWSKAIPKPFIASAERTGAITFRNELNLKRSSLLRLAHEMKADDQFTPFQILERVFDHGYPMPVSDNVEFTNRLSNISTQKSAFSLEKPLVMEFLDKIIGGNYAIKDGEVYFTPKGLRSKLKMGESSSAVRSLLLVNYYLKYVANIGDILIIDEPELNLHPSNQRLFARLIAMIVNSGIKVFITTHSDYLIKEFNTLIMMNNRTVKTEKIREAEGYNEIELLNPRDINLYTIESGKLYLPKNNQKRVRGTVTVKADVDEKYGLFAPSFDDTIDKMNSMQDELSEALEALG
jgi:AAA15 family ATPase/GTPase